MSNEKISEKPIKNLWQYCSGKEMIADTGESVQVIYPGRQSRDGGPDFHDAVITINNRRLKGDIEIHTEANHWFRHHHHQDPQYNQTILHAVLNLTYKCPTFTESGSRVPTVGLSPFLNHLFQNSCQSAVAVLGHLPCSSIWRHTDAPIRCLLEAAGIERFKLKVDRFRKTLATEGARQVLFSGIMRALGYAKNTKPFEELSRRLPLSFLEGLEPGGKVVLKQAYLLGTAGLLPSQRRQRQVPRDEEAVKLERLWQARGISQTMNETDWRFIGVRPTNFPVRRLIALSYLLQRYHKDSLLYKTLKQVAQAPLESGHSILEGSLLVTTTGYWAKHFDFGVTTTANSALLGRTKAAETVANVILPFTSAWADIAGEPQLKKKVCRLFRNYPKLSENEITQHMRQQLQIKDLATSLVHQQGLIHIFITYCREGNCHECPIIN